MRRLRQVGLGLVAWAICILLTWLPVGAQSASQAGAAIPNPRLRQSWIADQAQLLSPEAEKTLNTELDELYSRSGFGLAVVSVLKSPADQTPRELAGELLRQWDIRGAVLLVAVNDRRAELRSQPYLKSTLSDEAAALVLRQTVLPSLSRGRWEVGILAGCRQLANLIQINVDRVERLPRLPFSSIGWGAWVLSLLSFFVVGTETLPDRLLPLPSLQRFKLLYLFGIACGAMALLMWVATIAQLSLSVVVVAALLLMATLFLLVGWSRMA